jgi:hypothetical protein
MPMTMRGMTKTKRTTMTTTMMTMTMTRTTTTTDNKMGQIPAAGCAGAAGHAARARCSPPRPAVALAAAAATNVDQHAANFARAELDLLSFNFQARYPHVFIPTPSLTSGRVSVVGYWLVPSVDQTRVSVEVSTKGMHSIF